MVMTLRKRNRVQLHPVESETESERDTPQLNKKQKKKTGPKPRPTSSSSDSDKENEAAIGYENIREQRIRENKERMQKLGIFTLSSQFFNSDNKVGRRKKQPPPPKKKRFPPLYPRPRSPRSSRRSNRLMNTARPHYLESEGSLQDMGISIPDAWKSEIYTEEDEKLLGDCQTNWTLNVDGFNEDGDRLYDPDRIPCHQCRQKILGKLTFCGVCRSAQGQLCGDCLYTRYGENVMEAIENPSWSCPFCRGICNCSRCRRTKGWEPINIQYSKLVESGFKSVAHYLILTRRADTTPRELNDGIVTVDLTTEEATAPQLNDGSDYSAESSESDDSDSEDDSRRKNKNKEPPFEAEENNEPQSVEMQAEENQELQSVEMQAEESHEVDFATDKDLLVQEPTVQNVQS